MRSLSSALSDYFNNLIISKKQKLINSRPSIIKTIHGVPNHLPDFRSNENVNVETFFQLKPPISNPKKSVSLRLSLKTQHNGDVWEFSNEKGGCRAIYHF